MGLNCTAGTLVSAGGQELSPGEAWAPWPGPPRGLCVAALLGNGFVAMTEGPMCL